MRVAVKIEHKIVMLSVIVGLAMWCFDALLDALIFKRDSFLDELFLDVSPHEVYFRSLFAITVVLLGLAISRIVAKRNLTEDKFKKHSAAIESSMDGIAIYDATGAYLYVNQAYAAVNGYGSPQEIIGKTCHIAYDEKEYERIEQTIMPRLQKNKKWRGELIARRKNGSAYFQEASITMLDDGGRVCIVRDITWRKRSEERLQRSERFLNTIFNSIRDPFCIFDSDFRILRVNEAYAQMKNKPAEKLIGMKCYEVLTGRDSMCEGCVVGKTLDSADPCAKDKLVTLQDGTEIWMEIYTYPILDEEGKVSHVIEYTRDVTERRKIEDEKRRLIGKLEHLSKTDGLTGMINRRALTDSLAYEIDRAKRYGSELTLILCDVDNFKEINDTYGHDAGDRALQTLSATLKTILRNIDIAGRYGGDEFMIILPETTVRGAESLAEKLLSTVRETELRLPNDKHLRLSMSIGIAGLEADHSGENIDSFVKRADDAMYVSKQCGKDRVSVVNA
jgi:diguanylate cyclase (GGDEF)-like protein/PAS domain S-box-containing protein